MKVLTRCVLAFVGAAALSACVSDTGPRYGEEPSITIPYDPYDFDPDDLQAEADSHCAAYGRSAVYDGETANPQDVRWRYRHFRCV